MIVHWPDTDLSTVFHTDDESRMISTILEEVPLNPFQSGQDLSHEVTSTVLVDSSSDTSHNPERELYAGAGGSERAGEINRRLQT